MTSSDSNERHWVQLLCLAAVLHAFIFITAFPFFTSVDEEAHFDLAVKYSQGHPPRAMDKLSDETMNYYIVYSSQEYGRIPPPHKRYPPPVWTASPGIAAPIVTARRVLWNGPNHESSQPPLYYTLAGLWWRLGGLLGFHGGFLLYWLRYLNLVLIVLLVWLGYATARLVFPEDKFLRLGAAALIAFFPQPAFYSLQNDMLSALNFGLAFFLLLKIYRAEVPGLKRGIAAGLALAATFLTKASNLPLLEVAALFLCVKIYQMASNGKIRRAAPALVALTACAVLPTIAWMAWCKYNFGDLLGQETKIQYLGWTHKPIADWWGHPIFSLHGLWIFYSRLLGTFWQGEIFWHRQMMASPVTGIIYALLSTLLLAAAMIGLRSPAKTATDLTRPALSFAFGGTIFAVLFLGFLSIIYDFHDCFYPSREHPYFTSGRLMLGALIPFILLCIYGLDRLLRWLKLPNLCPLALGAMIVFMLGTEIMNDWPVFGSEYNWYQLKNVPSPAEMPAAIPAPPK